MTPAQSHSENEHARALKAIRQRIVQETRPGERLPTTRQLAVELEFSSATVQRAMRQLHEEGFVVCSRNAGTFVRQSPPHLTNYALVFPWSRTATPRSGLFHGLLDSAAAMERNTDLRFYCHYEEPGIERPVRYEVLIEQMRADRIAGIIFASEASGLERSALMLEKLDLPRILIAQSSHGEAARLPTVYPDLNAFLHMSLRRLREVGRKRLAVVSFDDPKKSEAATFERWSKLANAYGLRFDPKWLQFGTVHSPRIVKQSVRLMMDAGQIERPDAILVTDDSLVEAVAQGLSSAGIGSLRDGPSVAALAIAPNLPANPMGFALFGFDANELLARCVDAMAQIRRSERPAGATLIKPRDFTAATMSG